MSIVWLAVVIGWLISIKLIIIVLLIIKVSFVRSIGRTCVHFYVSVVIGVISIAYSSNAPTSSSVIMVIIVISTLVIIVIIIVVIGSIVAIVRPCYAPASP